MIIKHIEYGINDDYDINLREIHLIVCYYYVEYYLNDELFDQDQYVHQQLNYPV
eukprot:UN08117